MLSQLLLNGVPAGLIREMAQHNRQAIIGKIGLANIQARDLFQGAVRLAHPIPHGHFAMVALRDNMGQPNGGRPAPTQPLL
ncbi:MAG TPA: hypothetical protein VNG51_26615 [Ktedonobacteraceae bacterium]|nr:hypothetical protein [Ktedonobacteraceae bacterium]